MSCCLVSSKDQQLDPNSRTRTVQPTGSSDVKAAPVKAAPVKAAPVKAAPVKAAPVKAALVEVLLFESRCLPTYLSCQ
jgi:hypothetical protein